MRNVVVAFILSVTLLAPCQAAKVHSGENLFQENCANCHGIYAEGDGPASVDVGLPIPDLRYLTQSNAGIFPRDLVYRIIDGRTETEAHFPRRMPIWGYEFSLREGDDDSAEEKIKAKIDALTNYLESIQQNEK